MPQSVLNSGEEKMKKVIDAFKRELQTVKTGRANPNILNHLRVNYYGTDMPINQIASVSCPEATILMIKPYDKSALRDIEKAIQLSDLHMMPQNDGTVLRLIFPALTEETKKKLAKDVKASAENMKVGVRSARRDINEELKALEKESLISEDELEEYQEKSQELTDKYIKMLDELAKEKENQIMEI